MKTTRRALGGAHVPLTNVFQQLTGSVNKTILKPCLTAAANTYTYMSDFPDVKLRVAALIQYWRKQSGSGTKLWSVTVELVAALCS